ncbi:DMT family transporter [Hoeflea poritis]|uniref:DMT family transporter n=1 Tax=Hoeflea poritis TaxID=2993659 RepID=A0ABT4VHZ5_9HYPH|nr:DMT family transporter [Hoeflea poritis]MDA4844336.1 DMT family transporter [Hoeflea poritis]
MLQSTNMRGALYMALAMAGYVFNDALMKRLSENMSMGQAIFLRSIVASLLIFVIAWRSNALRPLKTILKPMPLLRTASEALATVLFLTALARIPLANAAAILQALPLAVTVGAALFLKEPVGWRRWLATLIGFVGVVLVIRPGLSGYSVYSLLVVGAVICAASRDLATRRMNKDIPSLFLSVLTAPVIAVTGLFMWIASGTVAPVETASFVEILGAAIFVLVGYQFIVLATRHGDIAFIVPFRYTGLLWSILLGILFFSEFPDGLTIAGSAIIVMTGLYTLYRERRTRLRSESVSQLEEAT